MMTSLVLLLLPACSALRAPPAALGAAVDFFGGRRCVLPRMQFGEPELPSLQDAMPSNAWDDNNFPLDPVAPPPPPRELRPIETVKVGRVGGPYKRRRGYHAEVAVQHPGAPSTIHRLWFAHEVLQDVAKQREGAKEHHIDVEEARATLSTFFPLPSHVHVQTVE